MEGLRNRGPQGSPPKAVEANDFFAAMQAFQKNNAAKYRLSPAPRTDDIPTGSEKVHADSGAPSSAQHPGAGGTSPSPTTQDLGDDHARVELKEGSAEVRDDNNRTLPSLGDVKHTNTAESLMGVKKGEYILKVKSLSTANCLDVTDGDASKVTDQNSHCSARSSFQANTKGEHLAASSSAPNSQGDDVLERSQPPKPVDNSGQFTPPKEKSSPPTPSEMRPAPLAPGHSADCPESTSESSDEVIFRRAQPREQIGARLHVEKFTPPESEDRPNQTADNKLATTINNEHRVSNNCSRDNGSATEGRFTLATSQVVLYNHSQPDGADHCHTGLASGQESTSPIAPTGPAANMQLSTIEAPNAETLTTKERLKLLQQQAMARIGRQVLGLDIDEAEKENSALALARQGPGTDPTSEIARAISCFIINPQATMEQLEGGSLLRKDVLPEGSSNGDRITSSSQAHPNISKSLATYQPNTDDSLPRFHATEDWAWESGGSDSVDYVLQWLDTTLNIGYEPKYPAIDTNDDKFKDGSSHAHGNQGAGMFHADFEEPPTFLNHSDPENEDHAHETVLGYIYNWRQRVEREQIEQHERKKRIAIAAAADALAVINALEPERVPYHPKANMYLRPAEDKDIPALLDIANWHIRHSVRCVELNGLTTADMRGRIIDCQVQRLPFLVAVERKRRFVQGGNGYTEGILGYAIASDFTAIRSTNRYTAELEVFVHPKSQRIGVGSCLLDKLLEVCDPKYYPKRGCFFECDPSTRANYKRGGRRELLRLIFLVHHAADDTSEYEWVKGWLGRDYRFEEQGLLKGTGVKNQEL
ncbi:hypothetical protein AJ80_00092 [Polytolypa hystricis UAMH7299]|uniref:N-acetyltransferase domain-containing protein n=1 Tax=Polytolypa hystricis (strain UAMH7299) TaxID=1447883 RepID=A0A2B7Z591_POLH7|nr:hypothetical protein AJ80_00092 [Polytolypa hystricis UAMH7299]